MPRNTNTRTTNDSPRGGANGHLTSVAPYSRDTRWATPVARRRTDVFIVDVADRFTSGSTSSDEDPLLLTA